MKVFRLTIENRIAALLFTILIVALGVTLLTIGVALLAGLAITGAIVGTGAAIYRRLRGKGDPLAGQRLSRGETLDPTLEVLPSRPPSVAPLKGPDN